KTVSSLGRFFYFPYAGSIHHLSNTRYSHEFISKLLLLERSLSLFEKISLKFPLTESRENLALLFEKFKITKTSLFPFFLRNANIARLSPTLSLSVCTSGSPAPKAGLAACKFKRAL